jgi:DNA polymerase-3 subunit delta'
VVSDPGTEVDLWAEVVGQPAAVAQLRAAAADPVHAYLLVGPAGSGRRAAARAFAADLLAAGLDRRDADAVRRAVAAEAHPSLVVVERTGARISKEQADEVIARAAVALAEHERRVFVLVDLHLVDVAGPQLLKTIEEPPPGNHFVVLADAVTPELVTIASRCVRIEFHAVPAAELARRLVADGLDEDVARSVAGAAGGSVSRARLLARDPEALARRRAWYDAPGRLDGSGHAACVVADELHGSIERLLEPLAALQEEETAAFLAPFEAAGTEPRKGDLDRLRARHQRQQRRVRTDELRAGLATLVERYRDELRAGADAAAFLEVAGRVQELSEGLAFNPNEGLQLRALLLSCPPLPPRR